MGAIIPKGLETFYFKFKIQVPVSRLILFHFEEYTAYFSQQCIKLSRIKESICP